MRMPYNNNTKNDYNENKNSNNKNKKGNNDNNNKNNDINTRVILKHVLNKNSVYVIHTNHYTRRDFTFID